jgi:diguanylate cyclase (GGDEF)-like protein
MDWNRIRSFIIRHRSSLGEVSLLAAVMGVATYIAFSVDIFMHEGQLTPRGSLIELDEMGLLGGLLAVGLLVFGCRRYVEQKREMRRRMAAEAHARELAYQDVLTGLPNRRQFDEALKAALDAPPRSGAAHALYLLDLNGFKQVNDVHGHGAGDEVLIVVAQRLRSAMRDGDMVARFGGDEFAVLARHLAGPEAATNVALRIIDTLGPPIAGGNAVHHVGAGIGIALLPADATTPEEAMRKADVALYRAKVERRSAMRFFEPQMDQRLNEREATERALREALAAGRIKPMFQPTFDLGSHRVVGFEALPTWFDEAQGEIPAERFIAIAEEAGLIHELAERLLRDACVAACAWPADVRLSIDIVPVQLRDEQLAARIVRILQETGFPAERLEVEITESAVVADLEGAQLTLGTLRGAGVRIVLDNFGTGYSSLYHLRNFKLDKIKIDRSFIETMRSEKESASIVHALVGLGHGLGLTIAAEGVQNGAQGLELLGNGCQEGQGDRLSEAMTAESTIAFFHASQDHRRSA